jgi:hypothetical protein
VRATRGNEMRKEKRSINERKRNEGKIKRELKERQGMMRKGVRLDEENQIKVKDERMEIRK